MAIRNLKWHVAHICGLHYTSLSDRVGNQNKTPLYQTHFWTNGLLNISNVNRRMKKGNTIQAFEHMHSNSSGYSYYVVLSKKHK